MSGLWRGWEALPDAAACCATKTATIWWGFKKERAKGFEPSTSALGSSQSNPPNDTKNTVYALHFSAGLHYIVLAFTLCVSIMKPCWEVFNDADQAAKEACSEAVVHEES
jgi:hypothetical protein